MLVKVALEEITDLGIPRRSLRGKASIDTWFFWIDHRCLKRHRRWAQKAPLLCGFGAPR